MIFFAGVGVGVFIGLITGVVLTAGLSLWIKMQQDPV